jgi:hypothetical protein
MEVMRLLAVLDNSIPTKARQGYFMVTFSCYRCWEVRVGVDVRVLALVVVVRS